MKKKIFLSALAALFLIPASVMGMPASAEATQNYDDDNVASLRQQIREKDEQIDRYLKKFISIASNFLYIPYEKYSINDVAIPAFEAAKGTNYYDKYYIRLQLLKNYKTNTDELKKFLMDNQNGGRRNMDYLPSWADRTLSQLNSLNVVKQYRQYGDGWDETFLGKIIYELQEVLDNPYGDNAYQRIDTKFAQSLKAVRQ